MKIVIFETADWERHACLRLAGQGDFHCTQEPLNAATAARYADAEIVSEYLSGVLASSRSANGGTTRAFRGRRLWRGCHQTS